MARDWLMFLCQTQVRNEKRQANAEYKAAGEVIKHGQKAKEMTCSSDANEGNCIYIEVKLISSESQTQRRHTHATKTSTRRVIWIQDSDSESNVVSDNNDEESIKVLSSSVRQVFSTKVLSIKMCGAPTIDSYAKRYSYS